MAHQRHYHSGSALIFRRLRRTARIPRHEACSQVFPDVTSGDFSDELYYRINTVTLF